MNTVLFRQVPGTTVIHRLWAGTKMLAVVAVSLLLMFRPHWPVLAVVIGFLLVTGLIARIPLGALPRLPWWFWMMTLAGALISVPVGTAAVIRYAQVIVLGLALLAASFMISWTTPLGEIAPAAAALGAPLRKLRLPVDEWAVAIALCLRCLPLLLEELRVLNAARRLRPRGGAPISADDNTLLDLTTAVLAVAIRRAAELGEAITARGGTGQLTAYPSRPQLRDVVALAVVAAVCGGATALDLLIQRA